MQEKLDRIAQSHIEGRVVRIRIAPHACAHCGAQYQDDPGWYPHRAGCPCLKGRRP